MGLDSSHFFLRSLQVKHPERDLLCILDESPTSFDFALDLSEEDGPGEVLGEGLSDLEDMAVDLCLG